jgi:CsoR family transcriptional regulator, copper-sensing transcriptional repressor
MAKTVMKKDCCEQDSRDINAVHPDHSAHLHRVNRIIGQLEGIARMISERRYCMDILTQTSAVKAALTSLEGKILEKHLSSCVREALSSNSQRAAGEKVKELVEMFAKRSR